MSAEAFHTACLDEMAGFAWRYMERQHGPGRSRGILWRFQSDNDFIIESDGSFELPAGSGGLTSRMARFSRATISKPTEIVNYSGEFLPEPVFSLQSVLQAAYPVNCDSNVFRNHDAGLAAGEPFSEEGALRTAHVAFGGLGVILMIQCRMIFGALMSNSEVIAKAENYWISILDKA